MTKKVDANEIKITEKIINLQNQINNFKTESKKIQDNFNFIIPDYILDEIIKNKNYVTYNYHNLYSLINCAVITKQLTKQQRKNFKKLLSYLNTLVNIIVNQCILFNNKN